MSYSDELLGPPEHQRWQAAHLQAALQLGGGGRVQLQVEAGLHAGQGEERPPNLCRPPLQAEKGCS